MNQPLIVRYAPTVLADMTFPNIELQAEITAHATGLAHGHLILYGDNGSGKTSLAEFIFEGLGGPDFDSIPGADLVDKVDTTMKKLDGWSCFSRVTLCGRFFLHIEELQKDSEGMSKFWLWLDKLPKDAKVIVTTNKLMAINKSIRSRMQAIHVPSLTPQQFLPVAQTILAAEGYADVPDAYVLQRLTAKAIPADNRKFYAEVERILLFLKQGFTLPAAPPPPTPTKPKLSVVKKK